MWQKSEIVWQNAEKLFVWLPHFTCHTFKSGSVANVLLWNSSECSNRKMSWKFRHNFLAHDFQKLSQEISRKPLLFYSYCSNFRIQYLSVYNLHFHQRIFSYISDRASHKRSYDPTGMPHLSYWERLTALNLRSLQRRQERSILVHTWKIIKGSVPNDLNMTFIKNSQYGNQTAAKSKTNNFMLKQYNFLISYPKQRRPWSHSTDTKHHSWHYWGIIIIGLV